MARIEKTEIVGCVTCKVNIDTGITLWQAIKLRIAGKNYEPIALEISKAIKSKLDKENTTVINSYSESKGSDVRLGVY